jgi:glycine C-acetyltransferase
MNKPAAKIFNSAYTANCGLALALSGKQTHWIGDELNHNSIIRAMRLANVPGERKGIYPHNHMEALRKCLEEVPQDVERVILIFDGIFSMRGDYTPVERIKEIAEPYKGRSRVWRAEANFKYRLAKIIFLDSPRIARE